MRHSIFWFTPHSPTVRLGSTGINCTFTPKAGWSGSDAHSHVSGMLMLQMTALTGRQCSANLSSEVLPFFESSDSHCSDWSGARFLPYVLVVEVVLHVCLDIYVSCTWLLTHFGTTFIKFPCWRSPVSWWNVFCAVRPTLVKKVGIWSDRF